jgi:hypothetical protein
MTKLSRMRQWERRRMDQLRQYQKEHKKQIEQRTSLFLNKFKHLKIRVV